MLSRKVWQKSSGSYFCKSKFEFFTNFIFLYRLFGFREPRVFQMKNVNVFIHDNYTICYTNLIVCLKINKLHHEVLNYIALHLLDILEPVWSIERQVILGRAMLGALCSWFTMLISRPVVKLRLLTSGQVVNYHRLGTFIICIPVIRLQIRYISQLSLMGKPVLLYANVGIKCVNVIMYLWIQIGELKEKHTF